eukprot:gene5530-5584_t
MPFEGAIPKVDPSAFIAATAEGGMLAAGALLPPGKRIGPYELWQGAPAKLARVLSPEEQSKFGANASHYAELAARYRAQTQAMAKLKHVILLAGFLAAGCAGAARVDTAVMPQGSFPASADVDRDALYEASQSVGLNATPPATLQGLARALADVEYVSGAYNTHARWIGIDGAATEGMLIARREVRDALAIPQNAPSQAVVNALTAVSRADTAPALQSALADPIFTLGPQATQARLQAFPSLYSTPYSIARLNRAIAEPRGESCQRIGC